ncbi:MAG: response regulator [Elusimicrobia bacterium]|nr:response regulator [Elusimicrobiota bacterium]
MSRKILVVDDDTDNRTIICSALSFSGYAVCQAQNGEEAVERALSEAPDLILMDLSMPILSGWEAAARIKATTRLRHIPIFAFTANALVGEDVRAREAGCDDFITKPCIPSDVVRRIAARLEA